MDEPEKDATGKPTELHYFDSGSDFLHKNYMLLGYHVTDIGQVVSELEPDVAGEIKRLMVATCRRMTRIMEKVHARADQ